MQRKQYENGFQDGKKMKTQAEEPMLLMLALHQQLRNKLLIF